ncbi:hypothetical protein ACNF49_14760 [Actinomadura sp. ATCC 39365]
MGMFNLVRPESKTICPQCDIEDYWWVQFMYGPLLLARYEIGSTIAWKTEGRREGFPGESHVFAEGVEQGCHHCGYQPAEEKKFDIEIRFDRIESVRESDGTIDYRGEYWTMIL